MVSANSPKVPSLCVILLFKIAVKQLPLECIATICGSKEKVIIINEPKLQIFAHVQDKSEWQEYLLF